MSLSYPKKSAGISTAPALDRPVTSLAEHVQTVMGSFFTIQQNLILNKKVPKEFLDEFKEEKQLFKSHCENIQRVLQSCYLHAADYATFSQRAVHDRLPSAKRCLTSARSVHRETQELGRTYQMIMTSLNERRSDLSVYLRALNKTRRGTVPPIERLPLGDRNGIQTLYSAVDGVQECLRDMIAFWDYHVEYLALVIKGQTNYPSPGEEAKAIFELWTHYQATLLQSRNSISASADALTVNPPRRAHTVPVTRAEKAQYQFSLKNLTIIIVKPLRNLGKYIRTKVVGNEPPAVSM